MQSTIYGLIRGLMIIFENFHEKVIDGHIQALGEERHGMSETRHPLPRLLSHLKHHRGRVIIASICSILNKFWDLAPPILIGMAIDVVVQREESFLASYGYPDPHQQFLILILH